MSEIATIRLTKEELWELKCNFDASFESGGEDNEIADRVAKKLDDAYKRMTKK
jgi:hypothetical protein